MPEVRHFARHDRDGLTALANRHIAAAFPGGSVPVATMLSQMERDSAEFVIDPWVIDRCTIVGIEADRVVAAAHLKRYGTDTRVSDDYSDAGEITWLICDPSQLEVGRAVLAAAMGQLTDWNVRVWYADGSLPYLLHGIPDCWPHVGRLLADAGFDDTAAQVEVVYAGDITDVAEPGEPPVDGVELRRVVGTLGTTFEAWIDGKRVGAFEVDASYGLANAQLARWADVADHWVRADHRRRGIGTWLVRHGCAWLRLGGRNRLLAYAIERRAHDLEPMENTVEATTPYLARFGLSPITRTRRGWRRAPG
jgi:GNAT superfamily N-acetyltransferase